MIRLCEPGHGGVFVGGKRINSAKDLFQDLNNDSTEDTETRKMKYVFGGRGCGKSSQLVKMSAESGLPIVTKSLASAAYIKFLAAKMNLEIPDVYMIQEVKHGRLRGMDWRGILIDDAESVIEDALREYLKVPVKAVSITTGKDKN